MAKFTKKVIKSKDNQPNRKFMEESENKLPLNKGTFWWYEWALKYVPLVIMLAHWYGVFDFHSNPREIIVDIEENESTLAYLYCMTYVFPVLMMMPASYFYQLCWIYRIPFVYLIGVNVIRMFYGSWLITNEMYDSDLILIILTCALYVYAFATRQCWRIGKLFIRKGRKWKKSPPGCIRQLDEDFFRMSCAC